jgi:hypothetical protein
VSGRALNVLSRLLAMSQSIMAWIGSRSDFSDQPSHSVYCF